ncbi:carboxypeptidase regulatory-like domain-containing protein [Immundisolibacter sp.]|uniref:carboxypeptidase regulatory-like domain-containing protein n=1 Tax=Immundisolibacter sp. TaxID=1934948 RepID=UPI0035623087
MAAKAAGCGRNISVMSAAAVLAWPAAALALEGEILDAAGKPVAQAMVTLRPATLALGNSSYTVFTDADGRYTLPAQAGGEHLSVRKLGYASQTVAPAAAARITLQGSDNFAAEAPPSAWMPRTGADDLARANTILQCTSCHQFPSQKVRDYSQMLDGKSEAEKQAAWKAMIDYMRVKFVQIGPDQSQYDPAQMDFKTILDPTQGSFDAHDEEQISAFLAKHLPTNFDQLKQYDYGAPLGVNARTVMREIQLPQDAFVREVGLTPDSPYLWGADLQHNRLLRVDPASGEQKPYPIPYPGPTGPHTIIDAPDGSFWVTMLEQGVVGRFDPKTEQWKLFDKFGKYEMAHDIAPNYKFQAMPDPKGRYWFTLIGSNRMASLDPETGEIFTVDTPKDDGESAMHSGLYSTVITRDGKRAWFSQLSGGIGAVNTETGKIDVYLPMPQGAGPRRMAIDDQDVLYVPMFGTGEILIYDSKTDKELGRVMMPDPNNASYSAVWDPWRRVVWLGTSNADVIYKFKPEDRSFEVFPMPSAMGYLRMITFDRSNGNLWTAYSNIPTGAGPSRFVMVDPGDGITVNAAR